MIRKNTPDSAGSPPPKGKAAQPKRAPQKNASAQKPNKAQNAEAEGEEEEEEIGSKFLLFNVMPSWLVSFVAHVALILLMAFFILPSIPDTSIGFEASDVPGEQLDAIDLNLDADLDVSEELMEQEVTEEIVEVVEEVAPEVSLDMPTEDFTEVDLTSEIFAASAEPTESTAVGSTNEVESRTGDSKKRLLSKYGGSEESEEAVERALKWIVDHQLPDGGWSFDHRIGPGKHRTSPDPGELKEARSGATAMALLPLLGNGQTHLEGKYKKNVRAGLEYLMARGTPNSNTGSVSYMEPGGTMYSHGLVSIVFAESFAMTKDSMLAPFAQGTIWFMEEAQDPVGGGWRYRVREAGDTSAVGWQVMAIKSAKLSGIKIKKKTFKLVDKFLKNVSADYGARYGYKDPPAGKRTNRACTAIGLLCRMYGGWPKDHAGLSAGVDYLEKAGPSADQNVEKVDMYYNYYATQVMKQYGGEPWKKWNAEMRDYLVDKQSKEGATAGSWMFNRKNHSSEKGGRLYCTAMATMTLEVYYRYLPLYSGKALEDDFPLD